MKKIKIFSKSIALLFLFTILFFASCAIYATQIKEKDNYKESILTSYKKEKLDVNAPIEIEISKNSEVQIPEINDKSKQLLNIFNKDISKEKNIKKIYDRTLNREVTRASLKDAEIDFDSSGNIVGYKNLDDFSTVDKYKKNYNKNEELPKIDYKIKKSSDLDYIISTLEKENDLVGYKLIDCSNNIESVWTVTWCRDYGNGLINSYDCINVLIDAKDGSVMLFGKNKIEPNSLEPIISEKQAIEYANSIISKYDYSEMKISLNFTRPNFYFESGGPYENANFVRLCYNIIIDNYLTIQVDSETGEILGGSKNKSVAARSMFVENFGNEQEMSMLAYNAFNRLGYVQSNYPPVYWRINQIDINWMLSRSDMYGLYLSCHGNVSDDKKINTLLATNSTGSGMWSVSSNQNFGTWRFVYLDACLSSTTNNFANAFHATYAGECFVGWNVIANVSMTEYFNRRFFPRLGTMSVYNNVITTLWETRNAGYNRPPSYFKDINNNICDPGFIGDTNYYGWAW